MVMDLLDLGDDQIERLECLLGSLHGRTGALDAGIHQALAAVHLGLQATNQLTYLVG